MQTTANLQPFNYSNKNLWRFPGPAGMIRGKARPTREQPKTHIDEFLSVWLMVASWPLDILKELSSHPKKIKPITSILSEVKHPINVVSANNANPVLYTDPQEWIPHELLLVHEAKSNEKIVISVSKGCFNFSFFFRATTLLGSVYLSRQELLKTRTLIALLRFVVSTMDCDGLICLYLHEPALRYLWACQIWDRML